MGSMARRSVLVRLTDKQREQLDELAATEGLPVQQFIELRIFGEVRPRRDPRAPRRADAQLPLAIDEEAPTRKSA
jgi:DNA-binding MarR family transcriptional regulator